MIKEEPILLAVHCLVYNHEPYLRKCLDGFVMQQTNFRFVAIVHEDCSKDNSAAIIREYEEKYPDIIRPIYESENQWTKAGSPLSTIMSDAIAATGAKYTAVCEGDDYWIDPLKLQKQVDILEADNSLIAVVTNSQTVNEDGFVILSKSDRVVPDNKEGRYNLREFFKYNNVYPTATVVYRTSHREERDRMFRKTLNGYLGDWTLWIILHTFGDFYYLDEVTSTYRMNPTSLTHTKVDERRLGLAKANFTIIKNVREILPDEYADIKKDLEKTAWMWFNLANAYKHLHQYVKMVGCLLVCGIKDPQLLYTKLRNRNKE